MENRTYKSADDFFQNNFLIRIRIGIWSGKRELREGSGEDSSKWRGKFVRYVDPDEAELRKMNSIANRLRKDVRDIGALFGIADGIYLLSNKARARIREKVEEARAEISQLADVLCSEERYGEIRAKARENLEDEEMKYFPSREGLRQKFTFRCVTMSFAPPKLAEGTEVEEFNDEMNTYLGAVGEGLRKELEDLVVHLYEVLAEPTRQIRTAVFSNLCKWMDRFPHRNFANDEFLEGMAEELDEVLMSFDLDAVRKDKEEREATALLLLPLAKKIKAEKKPIRRLIV